MAVLEPIAAAVGLAVWLLAALATRKAVIASVSMMIAVLVVSSIDGRHAWEALTIGGVAVLVVVRHRGNLARLRRGEEPSLKADRANRRSRGAVER